MNYQEFVQQIRDGVAAKVGDTGEVSVYPVEKVNGVHLDALSVRKSERTVFPAIYMDECYRIYEKGRNIEDIISDILALCEDEMFEINIDTSFFTEWENMKNRVVPKVINYQNNRKLLAEIPHRRFLDLAIVYYCLVDCEGMRDASILIRSEHLEIWNRTEDELFFLAYQNMQRLLPYTFLSMEDMISSLVEHKVEFPWEEEERSVMYVLTNDRGSYGAVWITDPEVQAMIADEIKDDFYILPSSVHECMVVPYQTAPHSMEMLQMVKEINQTEVAELEVLADSVYFYDRKQKRMRKIESQTDVEE